MDKRRTNQRTRRCRIELDVDVPPGFTIKEYFKYFISQCDCKVLNPEIYIKKDK